MVIYLECQLHRERGYQLTADSPILYGTSPSPGTVDPCTIIKEGEAMGTSTASSGLVCRRTTRASGLIPITQQTAETTATPDASKDQLRIRPFKPRRYIGLEQHQ